MFEVAASSEDKSFKTSRLDNHRHSSIDLVNLPPLMAMPLGLPKASLTAIQKAFCSGSLKD